MRFTDNGDGTVTDEKTGLMWEKETSGTGGVHDVSNLYTWSTEHPDGRGMEPDGTAFTVFLATLNNCPPLPVGQVGCFAQQHDWRLPTLSELDTIVEYSRRPAIDSIFGPATADYHWSGDNSGGNRYQAVGRTFSDPPRNPADFVRDKVEKHCVRAVRKAVPVCEHRWTLAGSVGP